MTNAPRIDDLVKDTASNKVGRVMGFVGPYVQLRPFGGGKEWDARLEHLGPVGTAEALSAGVAEANARSRKRVAVATGTAASVSEARDTPSTECALAQRPGYEELHNACHQTHDVFLPGANGILLAPGCSCRCHTTDKDLHADR
ncbi:hypothetical protein [Streptomyces sp. AC555_RSS877]|uniref:hypothetical protein n=1 Tax=Streptomyces sp. AC555_RSS877 TaxID=2823688 RepID=UPI0027E4C64E|nr:hypothetical protein [Streptomyces sp. AC555_RSS877]